MGKRTGLASFRKSSQTPLCTRRQCKWRGLLRLVRSTPFERLKLTSTTLVEVMDWTSRMGSTTKPGVLPSLIAMKGLWETFVRQHGLSSKSGQPNLHDALPSTPDHFLRHASMRVGITTVTN